MASNFLRALNILYDNPVKNRGHAYRLINDAGIPTDAKFFNSLVEWYEIRTGRSLGLSNRQKKELEKKRENMHELPLKEQACLMSLKEVRDFLYDNYSLLDELFFYISDLHRYEGMWPELSRKDFRHYYRHHILYVKPDYEFYCPVTYREPEPRFWEFPGSN